MRHKIIGIATVLSIVLLFWGSTGGQNSANTQIVIDGQSDDWADRPVMLKDPVGDAEAGFLDLTTGYAFVNQNALYFLIEAVDANAPFVQFDIRLEIRSMNKSADSSFLLISWAPGQQQAFIGDVTADWQPIGPALNSSFAFGPALEGRVDLRDVDSPEIIRLLEINVMVGECCQYPIWHPAEKWFAQNLPTRVVNESDENVVSEDIFGFGLPSQFSVEKVFDPPLQSPLQLAVSPLGPIVASEEAAGLVEIHEDGSEPTRMFEPILFRAVAFDSEGNLIAETNDRKLWKFSGISPPRTLIAEGVDGFALDVAPNGDIIAAHNGATNIQRIRSDGRVEKYASGFSGVGDVAVSPSGDVYVLDVGSHINPLKRGKIFKTNPNGPNVEITSAVTLPGLTTDASFISFAADGTLYHMENSASVSGLSTISLSNGTRTVLSWMREEGSGVSPKDFEFDSSGRVVVVDITQNHVVRFDLKNKTMEILWQGMGNSRALAVDSDGKVYFGVNSLDSAGHGMVVRIESNGNTTPVVEGLLRSVTALVVDAKGMAYVSAHQPGVWKSTIYATDLNGGSLRHVATLPYVSRSMAIDPSTGFVWGTGAGELWYIDENAVLYTVPFPNSTPGSDGNDDITFTLDGSLYVHANTSDSSIAPVSRGVYRYNPTNLTFSLVADLTTLNLCCVIGSISAASDGNIYWAGLGDRHTPNNAPEMHMLRITPAGEVTLFARNLPVDPLALTASFFGDDLYFNGGNGIYKVSGFDEK